MLCYLNDDTTRWTGMLGAPYGTDIWQFHDDKRQNGCFKTELANVKSKFFLKKRVPVLPAELLPDEIVIVLREALLKSFMINPLHHQFKHRLFIFLLLLSVKLDKIKIKLWLP